MTLRAYYYSRPARGPIFPILSYTLIHVTNSYPWTPSLEAWTDSHRAEEVGILLEISTIYCNMPSKRQCRPPPSSYGIPLDVEHCMVTPSPVQKAYSVL